MKSKWQGKKVELAVTAASVLLSAAAFGARSPAAFDTTAIAHFADIHAIERAAEGRLLAIGRIDALSKSRFTVSVLGQRFLILASRSNEKFMAGAELGEPVALFGEISGGRYLVDAAMRLNGQYIQGVSKVYLQGRVTGVDNRVGLVAVGSAQFDTSALTIRSAADSFRKGSLAAVVGTQPQLGGRVLVASIRKADFLQASVGTGRPDASVGTGRPDASLGTGRIDASLGTGRIDASVGTGRPDASLGTGRTNASVGTG